MAFQLGRIPRWVGGGTEFFSVMLHSFIVADLVPSYLKAHALIHDSPECVGNDLPSPIKTDATRAMESAIFDRSCSALRLGVLTTDEKLIIKEADRRSLRGEAWVVGNDGHRQVYSDRDYQAELLVSYYLNTFHYTETIERDGAGVEEFFVRYEEYNAIRLQHEWNRLSHAFDFTRS